MRQETQLADKGRSRVGLNTTSRGCTTMGQCSQLDQSQRGIKTRYQKAMASTLDGGEHGNDDDQNTSASK